MTVRKSGTLKRTALLLLCVLAVPGCSKEHTYDGSETRSLNGEVLIAEDHGHLHRLLGGMTGGELLELLGDILDSLEQLEREGRTAPGDYQTLLNILGNLRTALEEQADISGSVEAVVMLLEAAVTAGLGTILTDMVRHAGPDVLTARVVPLAAAVLAADDELLTHALDGIHIHGALERETFDAALDLLHDVLDPAGPYAPVHECLAELGKVFHEEAGKLKSEGEHLPAMISRGGGLPPEPTKVFEGELEGKLFTKSFPSKILDNSDCLLSAGGELLRLVQSEAGREDVSALLVSAGALLACPLSPGGHQAWDGPGSGEKTDFARMLYCLREMTDPAVVPREEFRAFVRSALDGLDLLAGANGLGGSLRGLGNVDLRYLPAMDDAITDHLLGSNTYGEPRGEGGVRTSLLRSLLYLLDVVVWVSDRMRSSGLPVMSVITSSSGTVDERCSLINWILGEIAVAAGEYPPSHQYIEGRTYPDSLEGVDWLFYGKSYSILHAGAFFPSASFTGLGGILDILDRAVIRDLAALPGVLTDPLPCLEPLIGSHGMARTTGLRHPVVALAAPIIQHFWSVGRTEDLARMLASLNEIDPARYIPLFLGENATFRRDDAGVVIKTLEGPDGHGLLTYVLREHGPDTAGILDPLLDLLVRGIRALEAAPGDDGTLLDTLLENLSLPDDADPETLLFGAVDDPGLVERIHALLSDGDAIPSLARIGQTLGELLLAVERTNLAGDLLDLLSLGGLPSLNLDDDAGQGLGVLLDFLLPEDEDSPLLQHLGALVCLLLDLHHETANPDGLPADTPAADRLEHLTSLYDLAPLLEFLREVSGTPALREALWSLVSPPPPGREGLLAQIFNGQHITPGFIRAFCLPVGPVSVLECVLGVVELEGTDMNGVLADLADLLAGADLRPGGRTHTLLVNLLRLISEQGEVLAYGR